MKGFSKGKVDTTIFIKKSKHDLLIMQIYVDDALCDEFWVLAIQEELNQFERNKVWTLVSRPKHHPIIGTKWVFKNKMNE